MPSGPPLGHGRPAIRGLSYRRIQAEVKAFEKILQLQSLRHDATIDHVDPELTRRIRTFWETPEAMSDEEVVSLGDQVEGIVDDTT